jgi:TorA maturation chaperone TorD
MTPALPLSLLQEAAEWRLISLLFEYPGAAWQASVAALGAEVRDPRLRQAAEAARTEAYEGMHHSLFGPGGPVPPREATYNSGVQLGYLLSELSAYYEAFSFQPCTHEPADHISVQTAFVAYLKLKEAYAQSCGDSEPAAISADAALQFIKDHLSNMVQPFVAALESFAPSYLVLAGQVLLERVGPPRIAPAPVVDALLNDMEDTGLTCGDAPSGLIQLHS